MNITIHLLYFIFLSSFFVSKVLPVIIANFLDKYAKYDPFFKGWGQRWVRGRFGRLFSGLEEAVGGKETRVKRRADKKWSCEPYLRHYHLSARTIYDCLVFPKLRVMSANREGLRRNYLPESRDGTLNYATNKCVPLKTMEHVFLCVCYRLYRVNLRKCSKCLGIPEF